MTQAQIAYLADKYTDRIIKSPRTDIRVGHDVVYQTLEEAIREATALEREETASSLNMSHMQTAHLS